jgi:hypothetical protein
MKIRIFQRLAREMDKHEYDIQQFLDNKNIEFYFSTMTSVGEGMNAYVVTAIYYTELE